MSQKTYTSSIYVKLGGQNAQNEDLSIKTVELDIDPKTKKIVKDSKNNKGHQETLTPPEFIIKPRRQSVNEGQSAKFKASFEGSPSTVLTWSKDGGVLHASRKFKIHKDERDIHILEVVSVSEDDGGIYTCTICNAAGTAKTTAELEVYCKPKKSSPKKVDVAPSVDSPLRDVKVCPGDKNVSIECKFSNALDASTCWYKDGQPLDKTLAARETFDGHLSRLTFAPVTDSHNGEYECAASNTGGEVRTCCRVSVMAPGTRSIPPKFINPLSDQVLNVGDQLVLEAKVTGYPRPSITWYKSQQEIQPSRVLRTEFDGSVVRLIMENVEETDSDSYKCIAENDVGIDQIKAKVVIQREIIRKSDTGLDAVQGDLVQPSFSPIQTSGKLTNTVQPSAEKLFIPVKQSSKGSSNHNTELLSPSDDSNREPPVFIRELHDVDVTEGDPVELLVEVKGTPPVEIVWVHNNSEVGEDHPVYSTTCSDNVHQLVIPKCKMEDAGEFVCEAYNEYGEIDTFCRLVVKDDDRTHTEPQPSHQRMKKVSTEKSSSHLSNMMECPPDFVLKPHSAIVEDGKSAIFLCRPKGAPSPTVQWLKQEKIIENDEKFKVTHGEDSILEIKNVSVEDCGKYTCLLLNSVGHVSTEIELSIGGTSHNISPPPESLPPTRKRSTPESNKRGGINKKIELFEKTEKISSVSLKATHLSPNTTQKRSPNTGRNREGRLHNQSHRSRSNEPTEDFRDVLNRIKPNQEKNLENESTSIRMETPVLQTDYSSIVGKRQRDKSPVKVSDAVKIFSKSIHNSGDQDKLLSSTRSSRKVDAVIESPKRFSDSDRPKTNVRKLANELTESLKGLTLNESPKSLTQSDNNNLEKVSELTVKERQAVLHGDLKSIIDKKQNLILQAELADGSKTHAKNLPSPDNENRPKRNFLAEASRTNSLEMGVVFGQKFEPTNSRTTPEKQKRISVIENPVTGPNEFQKMLEKKRNSMSANETPIRNLSSHSLDEKTPTQKENNISPLIKTNVSRVNNINEVLDRLKDKPPKPGHTGKQSSLSSVQFKSSERQARSGNMGETRRLSRESSPNFRSVLNQIEARTKDEQSNVPIQTKIDFKISSSPKRSQNISKISNKLEKHENSPVMDNSPVPRKSRVEFSPIHRRNNNTVDSKDSSETSENNELLVTETKLEMKRIERVQKWDELSKLYSSSNDTIESSPSQGQGDTKYVDHRFNSYNTNLNAGDGHDEVSNMQNERPRKNFTSDSSGFVSQNEVSSAERHRRKLSSDTSGFVSADDNDRNGFHNMNGLNSENDKNGDVNEDMRKGHAAMMNLKRAKLSEVEELFEDFSRIDRELESLKRNPKYGPLESLDVDDADKKILSKISSLSGNFTEDANGSTSDGSKGGLPKKQTKYSKKFDFEKSPATVEQLDFRHVLKRHVEPHHRQHPKFLLDLVDVKVLEGQPVTLECKVSGIPKPEVAWSMNNRRIKPSKFFRMTYEDNTAMLVIAGAYPEDDGEYVCSATNSLGTARCSCHLYVEDANNPSNDVTDEEGHSDLSSNQPSTPIRKISYSSTETPPSTQFFEQRHDNSTKQHELGTPSMPSVSTSLDESNFDENELDEEIIKKEAPRIHEISPKNAIVEQGQKLQLQVSFTAEPKPVVRWFRDSFEIISSQFYSINTTEHFSRLIISKVDGGDSGNYNVVIENEVGSDSANTSVTVLDVPSPPGKPYATETTLFSIILSWEAPVADGGSSVKHYKVEICNAEEETWKTLTENCSSTSYCASDLPAHNPFFFRISAKNKIGFSEPSQVSEVIVTKDSHPQHRLSVDSDDVFSTCIDNDSPISPFLPRAMQEEELPFTPRIVVPVAEKTFEDHYEKIEEVGKGKFGNVYKCLNKEDNKIWAAKVIKCRKKDEKLNVKNEISIMNELTHPKLLMLRDAYETPKSMVLVMEYIGGGELFDRVADEDLELTERDCVHFMRQICEGVRYMHEKSIMHLDLKPENILCVRKDSNLIKIIDFGLARRYKAGESLKVMFGTPEFIAPEVVNYEQIGLPTDIWSLGVICYVLLSGLSPFMGDNDNETLSNVTQGDFDFDDEAFDEISKEARDFIEKCLHKNMRKRLTVSQCIEHKWLAHSERNSSKKLRQSLRNLKQFMARRKWQKMGTAIRAIGRMATWQKQRGDSKSHDNSSINSDSDIASQSDLSILPASRTTSQGRDSREDNPDTSDYTETDEEVFNKTKDEDCVENHCENCENNNKHINTVADVSAPAEIIKDMVDCEAVKGDIVRFDIGVEGHPKPRVKWMHGQNVLYEDSRHSFLHGQNGICSLIIRDICETDEGEYTCKVDNDLGEDMCSAELIVYGVNAF